MYIGPWQELRLGQLLADHKRLMAENLHQQLQILKQQQLIVRHEAQQARIQAQSLVLPVPLTGDDSACQWGVRGCSARSRPRHSNTSSLESLPSIHRTPSANALPLSSSTFSHSAPLTQPQSVKAPKRRLAGGESKTRLTDIAVMKRHHVANMRRMYQMDAQQGDKRSEEAEVQVEVEVEGSTPSDWPTHEERKRLLVGSIPFRGDSFVPVDHAVGDREQRRGTPTPRDEVREQDADAPTLTPAPNQSHHTHSTVEPRATTPPVAPVINLHHSAVLANMSVDQAEVVSFFTTDRPRQSSEEEVMLTVRAELKHRHQHNDWAKLHQMVDTSDHTHTSTDAPVFQPWHTAPLPEPSPLAEPGAEKPVSLSLFARPSRDSGASKEQLAQARGSAPAAPAVADLDTLSVPPTLLSPRLSTPLLDSAADELLDWIETV